MRVRVDGMDYLSITSPAVGANSTSTRRFIWRPAAVLLSATGLASPKACVLRRSAPTPSCVRASFTVLARRSDSDWLLALLPTLSV